MKKLIRKNSLMFLSAVFVLVLSCFVFLQKDVRAATWQIETVDSLDNVGYDTSLSLDSSNNPRISYYDATNGNLKYAAWNGSAWNMETVDSTGNVGLNTSLALDSSNNPRISYYDNTNFDLKYASWNGSDWIIDKVDETGDVGGYTSLALDSVNNPHISYYDATLDDLKYASWNGSDWIIGKVNEIGDVSKYSSLVLDSSNNPRISYYDSTSLDLKYASWNGSVWVIKTVVDSEGVVGYYTSLALDSLNNPHISYYENADLKYASWNGFVWVIETVDSEGVDGYYTSLALDSSNNPHISYYDSTFFDLKYASWNGSDWIIDKVDETGDVGGFTSLALDSFNNPHISYLDNTNGDLKYAWADITAPITTASPVGGIYSSTQSVVLSAVDDFAVTTYYTTDGSEPTTSSTIYTVPISISQDKTLKFFSVDIYGNMENVKTEIYEFDRIILTSELRNQTITSCGLKFKFKKLPTKLIKNNKYWIKCKKIKKYPRSWQNAKKNALKKYWKIKTNLHKYKARKSSQKYKIKVAFKYTKKEFKKLKKRNGLAMEKNLFLKFKIKGGTWKSLSDVWTNAVIKHNTKKNNFAVSYFKKFPKKLYYFGIGLR